MRLSKHRRWDLLTALERIRLKNEDMAGGSYSAPQLAEGAGHLVSLQIEVLIPHPALDLIWPSPRESVRLVSERQTKFLPRRRAEGELSTCGTYFGGEREREGGRWDEGRLLIHASTLFSIGSSGRYGKMVGSEYWGWEGITGQKLTY